MKQVIFISSILLLLTSSVKAQELNCQIEIDYKQVLNTASKQIFDQMQKSIYEFMNNTKWTNDNYAPNEKIECSMLIIINKAASQEDFSGNHTNHLSQTDLQERHLHPNSEHRRRELSIQIPAVHESRI